MNICELKIQHGEDCARFVSILAFAGYKVSIEGWKGEHYLDKDYYVIVEEAEAALKKETERAD